LAVPRSMARSVEKYLETKENILIRKEFRATAFPVGTGVAYNIPKSR